MGFTLGLGFWEWVLKWVWGFGKGFYSGFRVLGMGFTGFRVLGMGFTVGLGFWEWVLQWV